MTLFRSIGRGRHRHRNAEGAAFAAYLRGTRVPTAEPMPPRPPEYRPPAVQKPEWWGRTAADDPPLDPCGTQYPAYEAKRSSSEGRTA